MESKIQEIELSKLRVHPKNVRKEYRDIEELTASIKEKGILQNLTVVPNPEEEGTYWVVIGNRRLTAALATGLESAPCSVVEMDEKDQTSTMLLENMQRSDLTPLEEADGFQLCLDLGMTEKDLSEKTGLSKTTIRHRTKMLELDREKLQKSMESGTVTLFDFIKLEKIKDVELKNKCLEKIGTKDFDYEVERALAEERKLANIERIEKELNTYATKVTETDNRYRYVTGVSPQIKDATIEKPEDADTEEYVYKTNEWNIALYKKIQESEAEVKAPEEKSAYEIKKEQDAERRRKFRELGERLYSLRRNFFESKERKSLTWIQLTYYACLICATTQMDHEGGPYSYDRDFELDADMWMSLNGYESEEKVCVEYIEKAIEQRKIKDFETILYACLESGEDIPTESWNEQYQQHDKFELLYEFLMAAGYKMSTQEEMILNGTHEYYKPTTSGDDSDE